MENSNFSVDIIRDELFNYFLGKPPMFNDETDVNGVVWRRAVKRGPVHIYTGKRGMKLLRRNIGGYSWKDPNIKKIRSICQKKRSSAKNR